VLLIVRYAVIAREERYLLRRFGDDYETFSRQVRRWL
jgi:protein-S-isoprenylcysteine O-methyltransferase Ste14